MVKSLFNFLSNFVFTVILLSDSNCCFLNFISSMTIEFSDSKKLISLKFKLSLFFSKVRFSLEIFPLGFL